jgi:hypothetical protein
MLAQILSGLRYAAGVNLDDWFILFIASKGGAGDRPRDAKAGCGPTCSVEYVNDRVP